MILTLPSVQLYSSNVQFFNSFLNPRTLRPGRTPWKFPFEALLRSYTVLLTRSMHVFQSRIALSANCSNFQEIFFKDLKKIMHLESIYVIL